MTREQSAAAILAAAAVVILAVPVLLDSSNFLAIPAAGISFAGSIGALSGGTAGRRLAAAVSVLGALLSSVWILGAADGFGKGTPWWDDLAEAAILVILFAGSTLLLRQPSPN